MAAMAGYCRGSCGLRLGFEAPGRRQARVVGRCLQPPNVGELCDKAKLSLTSQEAAELGPQISRVVDWFGQLRSVQLDNVAPAIRVGDTAGNATRSDDHLEFEQRNPMLASVGDKEGEFIKVPRILNENL